MTARTHFTIVVALSAGLLTSSTAFGQDTRTADRQALLGLARVKRDAGDRAAARRHFEDAARLRPFGRDEQAEYFWLLAGLDSSAALSTGRAVLADSPANHEVRDRMITEAIALKDETAVVQLATEGQRLASGTARWPRRLGESYLRQGRAEDAVAAYAAAGKAPDTVVHDRVGLAIALEGAGRHAESATTWEAIPASVRSEREEWERSRLRALALGAPPQVAADALALWLRSHEDDDATREMLVDVWVRAGQPDRALAAMPAPGNTPDKWTRRRIAVARSAGMHTTTIPALEGLVARGTATTADRWALATALVDSQQYDRAASTLRTFASKGTSCDDKLLTLTDRIPGAAATDLMMTMLAAPRCNDTPRWLQRGIARTLALSRHQEALALLARLPQADQNRPANRRLTGQLQLWTGDVRGAMATLEAVLESTPGDNEARAALVDAYRASHQTANAWRTAAPLLADTSLSPDRVVSLAELALEVDHPEKALSLLNRISSTSVNSIARTSMVGRALLALGRPAEARAALSSVPPSSLTPPAALALIDSVLAVSGASAALEIARQFPARAREWQDVMGRHAMLEAVAGDATRSASLFQALKGIDANAAVYAEAATALAMRRPHEALTVLAKLPDDPQPDRAADLESTALAGVGRIADALAIVVRLRKTHPDSPSLMIREADLSFQLSPTPDSLGRLVELSGGFPGNQMAAVALARSFATLRRHAEAIAALGPAASWRSLPDDGKLVLGRSLQALGRAGEALVIFSEADATNVAAQELRAELLAVVDGPGRAAEVFAQAAQRPDATPQLFMKWAAIAKPAAREDVLTRGTKRFPSHGGLLVALASARQTAGDSRGARQAALQAIEVDPQFADAWFVLLETTKDREDITDVVKRFDSAAAGHPALVIGMAERASRFIQSADDPLVASTIAWLDALRPADATQAMARDLARARIFSAAERWPESLGAVDTALARDPQSLPVLKLRAELLSWSGRHAEAIAAYDTYLAAAPHDVDARRQQARVAGWAGSFADAKRLYRSLVSAFPNDPIIAAEAEAKAAFFDERWRAATDAYARWITLEPENSEARFERAEALRAAGRIGEADTALAALASTPNEQIAAAALARNRAMRRPSASIIAESKSASGYEGQRLLDLREEGGGVRATFGDTGRVSLNTEAAHVRASAASLAYHGLHAGLTGAVAITPGFGLEAQASVWNFPIAGGVTPDVRIRTAWQPADRWVIGVGAEREPLFENLTTLQRRIAGTGAFVDAAFVSPRTSISVRASGQSLNDGNDRTRATVSMSQSVSNRLRQLRVVGWAESLSYRTSSADYYSPEQLLRLDVGLEYTHEFRAPRFRGDRQNVLAGGYLIGVDGDGTRYHHPSMRLQIEFARGLALDARAGWIRSDVYNETSLFLGLRIQTHGSQR